MGRNLSISRLRFNLTTRETPIEEQFELEQLQEQETPLITVSTADVSESESNNMSATNTHPLGQPNNQQQQPPANNQQQQPPANNQQQQPPPAGNQQPPSPVRPLPPPPPEAVNPQQQARANQQQNANL